MINGVLVERTVKDVIPALKVNSDGLKKVLEDLVKQYNKQQSDMEKWKVSWFTILRRCYRVVAETFVITRKRTISKSCSSRCMGGTGRNPS